MLPASILEAYDEFIGLLLETYAHYSSRIHEYIYSVSTTTYILTLFAICLPPILLLIVFEKEAARLRAAEPKGCRKLGLKIDSNLTNEFDPKFAKGFPASTEETSADWWRIKSLWIYPIKSCRGIEVNRSVILPTGMEFDRQFTFAQLKSPFPLPSDTSEAEKQAHSWQFITQRQFPLLARVRTEMWAPDQSVDTYAPHVDDVEGGGVIIISFPYCAGGFRGKLAQWGAAIKGTVPEKSFRVPFNPTPCQIDQKGYKYEKLTIWKDDVQALNMELEIPEELRYFLGISNKLGLFRIDNAALREVHRCAPTKDEIGFQPVCAFQDAYPLHLINLASIRDVEDQMPQGKGIPRLSAMRFRANIIITGPEKYTEETWKRIKIGFYEYAVSCRTTRCRLPNTDQLTGEKHNSEPDKTLRRIRNIDEGAGDKIGCLGMQMCPVGKESQFKVGDEIIVLEHGKHVWQ